MFIKKKRSRCEKSNMTFAETHTEIKLARERDRARCSCYTDTILLENSKKGFVTKDKSQTANQHICFQKARQHLGVVPQLTSAHVREGQETNSNLKTRRRIFTVPKIAVHVKHTHNILVTRKSNAVTHTLAKQPFFPRTRYALVSLCHRRTDFRAEFQNKTFIQPNSDFK